MFCACETLACPRLVSYVRQAKTRSQTLIQNLVSYLLSVTVSTNRHFLTSLCNFFLKVYNPKMQSQDKVIYSEASGYECIQYSDVSLWISARFSAADLGKLFERALGHTCTGRVHGWETAGPHPYHHHGHCADLQR